MSEEVYTVEQFAERLKLHPKTVLRFIRDTINDLLRRGPTNCFAGGQ